jgi:hypothetical protein
MAEGLIALIPGIRNRKSQEFPLSTKPTGRIQVEIRTPHFECISEIQNGAPVL